MAKAQSDTIVIILVLAALVIGQKNGLFDLTELWNSIFGGGTTTPPPPGGGTTTPPPSGGGSIPAGTVLYDSVLMDGQT